MNNIITSEARVSPLTNDTYSEQGETIIQLYLDTLNTETTKRTYAKSINEFFNFLYETTNISLMQMVIDPKEAIKYANFWKNEFTKGEIKSSTYNSKIKGIKYFYDWLISHTTKNTDKHKLFIINPFDAVKQMAENDAEGSEPLSPSEIELMLNHPYGEDTHKQERNLLMFEMAITTGIRCEALITITPTNIKRVGDDWILSVLEKENKWSHKPINNYRERLMEWYHKDKVNRTSDSGTIFNIHPHSANRIIGRWAKDLGIDKKITFHSLRTTTAVQIYHNSGNNLYRVQMMLNHEHLETSKIYVQKEHKINHDGEKIIPIIKNNKSEVETFDNMIPSMTKDELVDMLLGLDMDSKLMLMEKLRCDM